MDEGNGGVDGEGEDMKRLLGGERRFGDTEQDLVAVALAHNTVEVCMVYLQNNTCNRSRWQDTACSTPPSRRDPPPYISFSVRGLILALKR